MNRIVGIPAGIVASLSLALGSAAASAQEVVGSFEQTLEVGDALELDVTTGSGSIDVRSGPAGRVEIAARITVWGWRRRFSGDEARELVDRIEANPPIELVGNRLRVGHLDDPDFRDVSISYEIEVPADTRVDARSGSGAQTISRVRGPVEASAGSGSLTLTDIGGDVEANTGSGTIRAEGIAGAFRGAAGSGSIRLVQNAPGDVTVTTGSGSTDLRGVVGALRARSGSGSITVDGRQTGPWELAAGSGTIRVRLPEDAAFDLDAEARSGAIYTDHPVTVRNRIAEGRLSGSVRGGGPLLRVRTGSGGIRIE